MKVQCCVCKRVRQKKRWLHPAGGKLQNEAVSHGYCPRCAASAFRDIHQQQACALPVES